MTFTGEIKRWMDGYFGRRHALESASGWLESSESCGSCGSAGSHRIKLVRSFFVVEPTIPGVDFEQCSRSVDNNSTNQ